MCCVLNLCLSYIGLSVLSVNLFVCDPLSLTPSPPPVSSHTTFPRVYSPSLHPFLSLSISTLTHPPTPSPLFSYFHFTLCFVFAASPILLLSLQPPPSSQSSLLFLLPLQLPLLSPLLLPSLTKPLYITCISPPLAYIPSSPSLSTHTHTTTHVNELSREGQ